MEQATKEQYKACFVHNNKTHNQQKEIYMWEKIANMTLECKVKTKIIIKMNYKLLTKITKHNLERKNLEKKQVINNHHQMQNISQKWNPRRMQGKNENLAPPKKKDELNVKPNKNRSR
jgi:hypothetical protein